MSGDEPKPDLIVDEDWKTKVEREKETFANPAASQPGAAETAAKSSTGEAAQAPGPIPPATLTTLLTTLGTQSLLMLGQIIHPMTNKREVDLDQARHFIDLLAMLEQKTQGNRSAEESQLLDGLLYDLRILYVQMKK